MASLQKAVDLTLSDQDIYEAMKEILGYLDITPGNFKTLYEIAHKHTLKRITDSVRAKDIMTREVVTVQASTPLSEAATLMASKRISGVPVVADNSHVVGVLSERDFLSQMGNTNTTRFMDVVARCLTAKGCAAMAIRAKTVRDIMTTPAITVAQETRFLDASTLLKKQKINRLPVTDQQGLLVGIITRENVINSYCLNGL